MLLLLIVRAQCLYDKILLIVFGGITLFISPDLLGQNTTTACGQPVAYPLDGCAPCTQSYTNFNGSIDFTGPNQTACITGTSTITGINSTISDTLRICGNVTITGSLSSWGSPINIIVASSGTLNWQIDPSAGASRNVTNYGISNYNVGIANVNNVTYISASSSAQLNITGNYTLNGINTFVFLGGILNITGTLTLNSSVNALCLSGNAIIAANSVVTMADNNILVDPSSGSCLSFGNSATANGHFLTQDKLGICQQVGANDPVYSGVPNFGPQVTVYKNCTDCKSLLETLPITLQSFTVAITNTKEAALTWVSTEEVNTDRFNIQRSGDATSFETIGTVNATGNSSMPITYTYIDRLPVTGLNYYRLQMVDIDGKYTYSPIKSITFAGNTGFKLVNNTGRNLLFALPQTESTAFVRLMNMQGSILWQKNISANQSNLTVPVAEIATGLYIIQYYGSGRQTSQQLFIHH